ncbi:hypothetical protein MO973_09880 [Paenibacillus sp. TRM 82003]|uniref:hypothetical protein n=1 Tax=Kineococcus sp. TRM81007 TaxID=2925831 RepID=UPI001F5609F3|nr:hypothetical protein [Kineococcus sp. TRM81007]MCI2238157.1 hypothetical protein [Kineococcus sp. TRM81007]MCI3920541.1 hypothetical protein [Paenibacillus sp. TRM 82003]
MRITEGQAAARVRAALGREPQDALESAVVLEAWGGLVPRAAVPLARRSTAASAAPPPAEAPAVRRPREVTPSDPRELLGLVAALLATTAWVGPLAAEFGTGVTEQAWKLALPVSFGLQWLLRRRWLTDADGLGRLRAERGPALAVGLLSALVPVAVLLAPQQALVAALVAALVVTWVGSLVVVVRGWGVPYALALVLASLAVRAGVPVRVDVLAVVLLTQGAVAAAVLTTAPSPRPPTPWGRSLPAAAVGAGTALLVVLDPSVGWTSTATFPVVALVPSLLGSIWANRHLDRVWTVLLDVLASTRLREQARSRAAGVFGGIVAGAFARLLLLTTAASLALGAVLRTAGAAPSALTALLLGLGCFGVVGFLAGVLEAYSRLAAAGAVVAAALTAEVLTGAGVLGGAVPPLVAAAVVATLTAVPAVVRLVHRPARTLATML